MNDDILKHTVDTPVPQSIEETVQALTAEPAPLPTAQTNEAAMDVAFREHTLRLSDDPLPYRPGPEMQQLVEDAQADRVSDVHQDFIDAVPRMVQDARDGKEPLVVLDSLPASFLNPTGEPTVGEVVEYQRSGKIPDRFAHQADPRRAFGTPHYVNNSQDGAHIAARTPEHRDMMNRITQELNVEFLKKIGGVESSASAQLPRVSISDALIEGEPLPAYAPEISGEIPVYADSTVMVRNTPGHGWSLQWEWEGQRAWVPFDRLPRFTLKMIHEHLKNRRYFPKAAAAFAFGLLNFPPRPHVKPGEALITHEGGHTVVKAEGGSITIPAGIKGSASVTYGDPREGGTYKARPFRNPQKQELKAQRKLRKEQRKHGG